MTRERTMFDPTKPMRLVFNGDPRSGHAYDSEGREVYLKNVKIKCGVDYEPPQVSVQLVSMPFEYVGPADVFVICEHCGEKSVVLVIREQVLADPLMNQAEKADP